MKKEVKSQAALEFLTTYAWAFLVMLIAIAALYYFGIFDFSKFLPQKCLFPSQFECLDFSFKGDDPYGQANDQIGFKLVNGIGEELSITNFVITNDAEPSLECDIPPAEDPVLLGIDIEWAEGIEYGFNFTNCRNGAFLTGERTEAKITITYCAPATGTCEFGCDALDCPNHEIKGKITAVVI